MYYEKKTDQYKFNITLIMNRTAFQSVCKLQDNYKYIIDVKEKIKNIFINIKQASFFLDSHFSIYN